MLQSLINFIKKLSFVNFSFLIYTWVLSNLRQLTTQIQAKILKFSKKMPIYILRKGIKVSKMGLNITHTMNNSQFENRETLRNAAKNILNRNGATQETTQRVIEKTIFNNNLYNPQLSIIQASTQITINNSLKETLKYLNSNPNKKTTKKHILGELWENVNKEEFSYEGELVDFVIDSSAKNIFAAA